MRDVRFDRADADIQTLGDFLFAQRFGDKFGDARFGFGQIVGIDVVRRGGIFVGDNCFRWICVCRERDAAVRSRNLLQDIFNR